MPLWLVRIAGVFLLARQTRYDGRPPRECRDTAKLLVRFRMEAVVIVLDVEIWWQFDRLELVKWNTRVNGLQIELPNVICMSK